MPLLSTATIGAAITASHAQLTIREPQANADRLGLNEVAQYSGRSALPRSRIEQAPSTKIHGGLELT